jgi:hypothetical protein
MSTITKLLLVPALVVAFSVGVSIAASGSGTSTPDPLPAGNATTTVDSGGTVDLSGPCDEAEHANDPRCTGAGAVAEDDHGKSSSSGRSHAEDDRGDDDSGHGSDDSGHGSDDSGHDD